MHSSFHFCDWKWTMSMSETCLAFGTIIVNKLCLPFTHLLCFLFKPCWNFTLACISYNDCFSNVNKELKKISQILLQKTNFLMFAGLFQYWEILSLLLQRWNTLPHYSSTWNFFLVAYLGVPGIKSQSMWSHTDGHKEIPLS